MEFTKQDAAIIRWHSIRVIADYAECGPYRIEKTAKMYKVTHVNGTVKRFKCLKQAVKMITGERLIHARKWAMDHPYNSVYYYSG